MVGRLSGGRRERREACSEQEVRVRGQETKFAMDHFSRQILCAWWVFVGLWPAVVLVATFEAFNTAVAVVFEYAANATLWCINTSFLPCQTFVVNM